MWQQDISMLWLASKSLLEGVSSGKVSSEILLILPNKILKKTLILYMNSYIKIYYWFWLSLRIVFTYFIICWSAVLIAILLDFNTHLTGGSLSIWGSAKIFLSYLFYPIPVTVLILFLLNKIIKKETRKKIWFVVASAVWHFLAISSLGGATNFLEDHKGAHNIYLFNIIMGSLIIVTHIFWVRKEKWSFAEIELSDRKKEYQIGVVRLFFVYYTSIAISSLFSLNNLNNCFKGFILDEMVMTFNGTLTIIILCYGLILGLIHKLKFRMLFIILIPVIYLSYGQFLLHSGYKVFSDFYKFRELLVHHNPIWLGKEERGHTEFNP